jgi:dephospho-CoA kinase
MSGTGKSSVVRDLAARGFKAVDTDDGWSEPLTDGRQRWREDAIQALLATEDADVLFVAGCEENQAQFHAQFDHIILLSAPLEVLVGRLAARKSSAASLMTSRPLSPCCGEWPITRSGQPSRWTRW